MEAGLVCLIFSLQLHKGSSSVQYRDNNDNHNNNCVNVVDNIDAVSKHRGMLYITKIVPPVEKNKELFYLFFYRSFYYEQAFVIAIR